MTELLQSQNLTVIPDFQIASKNISNLTVATNSTSTDDVVPSAVDSPEADPNAEQASLTAPVAETIGEGAVASNVVSQKPTSESVAPVLTESPPVDAHMEMPVAITTIPAAIQRERPNEAPPVSLGELARKSIATSSGLMTDRSTVSDVKPAVILERTVRQWDLLTVQLPVESYDHNGKLRLTEEVSTAVLDHQKELFSWRPESAPSTPQEFHITEQLGELTRDALVIKVAVEPAYVPNDQYLTPVYPIGVTTLTGKQLRSAVQAVLDVPQPKLRSDFHALHQKVLHSSLSPVQEGRVHLAEVVQMLQLSSLQLTDYDALLRTLQNVRTVPGHEFQQEWFKLWTFIARNQKDDHENALASALRFATLLAEAQGHENTELEFRAYRLGRALAYLDIVHQNDRLKVPVRDCQSGVVQTLSQHSTISLTFQDGINNVIHQFESATWQLQTKHQAAEAARLQEVAKLEDLLAQVQSASDKEIAAFELQTKEKVTPIEKVRMQDQMAWQAAKAEFDSKKANYDQLSAERNRYVALAMSARDEYDAAVADGQNAQRDINDKFNVDQAKIRLRLANERAARADNNWKVATRRVAEIQVFVTQAEGVLRTLDAQGAALLKKIQVADDKINQANQEFAAFQAQSRQRVQQVAQNLKRMQEPTPKSPPVRLQRLQILPFEPDRERRDLLNSIPNE